jgi:Ser/Thr protein kinase RdoA (MazF antagonist)
MMNSWKSLLLDRAEEWGVPTGKNWKLLLSNNYQPQYSTLALLWFHGRSEFPSVVAKLFREPEIPHREFANLSEVHARAPQFTPRPLRLEQHDAFWILWLRGVPGYPLKSERSPSSATFLGLADMVTSLHRAVQTRVAFGDESRYRRMVLEPLQSLAGFGKAESIQADCSRIEEQTSQSWLDALPTIPQHGDLHCGNVLRCRDEWHIVDWETYGIVDLPYYDLVTLLLSLLELRSSSPAEWDPFAAQQVRGVAATYARAFRLSREDLSRLLPLILANWFRIQWSDGRQRFVRDMYPIIRHYFANRKQWEDALLPTGPD